MKIVHKYFVTGIILVFICFFAYQILSNYQVTFLRRQILPLSKKAHNNLTFRLNKYTTKDGQFKVIIPILKKNNFLKGTLKSAGRSMVIYLHHQNDMISKSILSYGTWEGWLLDQLSEYIRNNTDIQILDAGCNVGVYTLTAAALGARVVCLDANQENTERVAQSVVENGLTDKVMILLNALTNVHKEFIMTKNDANIGSENILEDAVDPRRVKSVFMDDLLPLFDRDKPVMIKIDIESREIEAFQKAHRFFEEMNVKLILMEWEYIKRKEEIKFLLEFFTKRHFSPFKNFKKDSPLSLNSYLSWPMDVVWIRT